MLAAWQLDSSLTRHFFVNAKTFSDIFSDISYSDKDLHDKYGDIPVEPIILGNIICSEHVKNFLKLPSKIRVYNRLNKAKIVVEVETNACQQRWSACDASDIPIPDRNNPDIIKSHVRKLREIKDNDCKLRKPVKNKTVDFRNMRAT